MKAPSSMSRLIENCFRCAPVVLLLMFVSLNAQTGTVVDNADNKPIKNAVVALKSTGALALTDKDGKFTFSTAVVPVEQKVLLSPSITFANGIVSFSIDNVETPVSIKMYTANGRQIADVANKVFQPGQHHLPLPLSSANLYIAHITIGKEEYITKLISTSHTLAPSRPRASRTLTPSYPRTLASTTSDTLIVSKYLYTSITQPLTPNATIKLSKPETPPSPPGMKSIPGGTFIMGANNPQIYEQNEIPPHEVTVSPFFMDSTEVTQADYVLLMGISPWTEYVIVNPGVKYPGAGNKLPAWFLTWDDAALYCNARSNRDGLDTVYTYSGLKSGVYGSNSVLLDVKIDYAKKGYRLPTEAEWEYAARAKSTAEFYWGNKADSTALKYARFNTDSPIPVASLLPNAFGMYDIVGNVFECVNDFHDFYPDSIQIDPLGPSSGTSRCLRGGSWTGRITSTCRIPRRLTAGPRDVNIEMGIRVVHPNK